MTVTKNLGIVRAIHIGTIAPTNTQMIWYDTNVGINLHKYYNTLTSIWEVLVGLIFVNIFSDLPLAGDEGKLYIVRNTNKIYRWNGSKYLEISSENRKRTVINLVNPTNPPPSTNEGDRYILNGFGVIHANWGGDAGSNFIMEYDGSNWITEGLPQEGWICYVDEENKDALYVDDGSPQWELRDLGEIELKEIINDNSTKNIIIGDKTLIRKIKINYTLTTELEDYFEAGEIMILHDDLNSEIVNHLQSDYLSEISLNSDLNGNNIRLNIIVSSLGDNLIFRYKINTISLT